MADANARLSQALLDTNGLIQDFQYAEGMIDEIVADKFSIRTTSALMAVGDVAQRGTDTLRKRRMGLGYSLSFAAKTEQESTSASSFDSEVVDVAVGRYALALELTYAAEMVRDAAIPDAMALANTFVDSFEGTFMDVLADTIMGFSTDKGTSAAAATIDDVFDVKFYFLENSTGLIEGDVYFMLHGHQLAQIENSLRAEAGAFQYRQDVQGFLDMQKQGFKGQLLGMNFFASNRVNSSGGNRHGAAWVPGALGYAFGTPSAVMNTFQAMKPANLPLIVEFDAAPATATRTIYGNAWFGQAITYDLKGVGFVTAA